MPHYLRRVKLYEYCFIFDDDILINYDLKDVIDAILEKRPVLITEPYHSYCDKSLYHRFLLLAGESFEKKYLERNPNGYGFNAGFQGIDLRIYDDFLSSIGLVNMINLFDCSPIFDDEGNELISGYKRTELELQQQSFFGLLNVVKSKKEPYILDPKTNYVAPGFGYCDLHGEISKDDGFDGWGVCLKSKISHFICHTEGRGKPKQFIERMDLYLKEQGFM